MRTWSILIFLFYSCSLWANGEVPKVHHFYPHDYHAQGQNWSITQDSERLVHFGNSDGLLSFDGNRWRTKRHSFGQFVRAVHSDEKGRIYIGGFATIGFWEVDDNHQEVFVSLADKVPGGDFQTEEIWHILPLPDGLLFQSFSTIYLYDYEKIDTIRMPGNIMFARRINDRTIVPVIDRGLYELRDDGSFSFIPGSEVFAGKRVATILPIGAEGEYLVCLQNDGVFTKNNNRFSRWDSPLNEQLKSLQLNKGIRLSNGNFAFGTILGGLFVLDEKGKLVHHISQENGLQNNTVLSLFEDREHLLWVGLDKGIDLVDIHSPLLFYPDKSGQIGTVYTAAVHQGTLYVGSNQGVFFKQFPSGKTEFNLISGSQGQVWDLQVFDGHLLGGHNSGTIYIEGSEMRFLNQEAGAFSFVRHPNRKDILLQGSYIGINVFEKNKMTGDWTFSHRINGISYPVRQLFFDKEGWLWARHNRKGIARLKFDDDLKSTDSAQNFGNRDGLPSQFGLQIHKVGNDVYVKHPNGLIKWDYEKQIFQNAETFEKPKGKDEDYGFDIYPNRIEWGASGEEYVFHVDLPSSNGCIIPLSTEYCLLCVEEGYALLPRNSASPVDMENEIPTPVISRLTINENKENIKVLYPQKDSLVFEPWEHHLRLFFSMPVYGKSTRLRSRLVGFDSEWTAYGVEGNREFTNLPSGEYTFQVQAENNEKIASLYFSIQPRWYQTVWAKALFSLFFVLLSLLLFRLHRARLKRHLNKVKLENEKELKRRQMLAENKMLQTEVKNKSRKLADTTMNLVRKNETLININEQLAQAKQLKDSVKLKKHLSSLTKLVEGHLTSEEDWRMFEENFNQLHDQFFKRLKEQFPELTPGDFRLAAYLKMNLSSKEIAPLLNISLRGVENKRYRLRKKMGLDKEVNLTEFFMQF